MARSPQPTAAVFCLARESADLRARIEARVDAMFSAGLLEETRQLLTKGLADNRTAMQALGYRQVVEHLRGNRGLAETVALVKTRTWQFARRQGTWFRRQLPMERIPLATDVEPTAVADGLRVRITQT